MQTLIGRDLDLDIPIYSGLVHERREPCLRIDGLRGARTVRETSPLVGLTIRWARLRGRRCTGYFDLSDYSSYPCPAFRRLSGKTDTQCSECWRRSGFNPAFYNVGEADISPQQRAYNARPHVVYLAGFDRHLIKVGISSRDRAANRLREQGAVAAYLVAQVDDAAAARRIEATIINDGGIGESISRSRKLRALSAGVSPSAVDEAVGAECYRLIGEGVIDAWQSITSCSDRLECNRTAADLAKGAIDHSSASPLAIVGTVVGAAGPFLVIDCDRNKRLIVDGKNFSGHRIGAADTTLGNFSTAQSRLL
jgi:hypothetical protein